jgi:hypothetical protein
MVAQPERIAGKSTAKKSQPSSPLDFASNAATLRASGDDVDEGTEFWVNVKDKKKTGTREVRMRRGSR